MDKEEEYKKEEYNDFVRKLNSCVICAGKYGFMPKPVIWGSPNAKIVQISQAPSRRVYETGKPFNDLSGKRLREWYGIDEGTFYNTKLFYMTAMAHCYPGKNAVGKDLDPPRICAKKWLYAELTLLNNKIYIIIGRIAAGFLFPNKPFRRLIIDIQTLNGKPAFVLPHPSPQNIKWFKDHPEFYDICLPRIRRFIKDINEGT